jgi:hypothetical protein
MSDSDATSQYSDWDEHAPLPNDDPMPFCLEDVPPTLDTDDPVSQGDLLRHLNLEGSNQRFEDEFETMPVNKIPLSFLKRQYENKYTHRAISSMSERHQVQLDDRSVYPQDSPSITFRCTDHHLDFLMAVSSGMGLDAILPNAWPDLNWVFCLDLTQPIRSWRTNYGKLGFDSGGRMLYIGKRGREDVWLAFAPLPWILDTLTEDPAGLQTGASHLESLRYRRFAAFIGQALNDMAYTDVTATVPYPDVESGTHMRRTTNIL